MVPPSRVGERYPLAARHCRLAGSASRRHLEPCVRFSRTRLSDVLHREAFGVPLHGLFGRGAITVPCRSISPTRAGTPLASSQRA